MNFINKHVLNNPKHVYIRVGFETLDLVSKKYKKYKNTQKKTTNQRTQISGNSLQLKKYSLRNKFSNNFYFPTVKDIETARKKFIENEF